MKAVVWQGIGDIRLSDVPEPKIKEPTDAIVRLTASAICGTDLHFVRGTRADNTVTVFGCGPIGQFTIASKKLRMQDAFSRSMTFRAAWKWRKPKELKSSTLIGGIR